MPWRTQLCPGGPWTWPPCCPCCCGCGTAACWRPPRRAFCSLAASRRQTTTDWQTHICIKEKAKHEVISFLLRNTCRTFISLWILSLLWFLLWLFLSTLWKLCRLVVFFLRCSSVLKLWSTIHVWPCVLFGLAEKRFRLPSCSLGQKWKPVEDYIPMNHWRNGTHYVN